MINNVTLVGRLTKDPEINYAKTGIAITKFTVACDRYKGDTDFIRVVVFDKQAESAANYLVKGSMVGVAGSIKTGSYEDKDGKKVFTTEVQAREVKFLSPKNDSKQEPSSQVDEFAEIEDEDDLPF